MTHHIPDLGELTAMVNRPIPGDKVRVRNADGGYLSHLVAGRPVVTEYTVHEVSPVLGVRVYDAQAGRRVRFPLADVEVVGHLQPVNAPADPYVEQVLAYRRAVIKYAREALRQTLAPKAEGGAR